MSETTMEVYTVEEVQTMLGINKNKAYELAMSGKFPAKKLGRRIIIPKKTFDEWLYT
jgi:excisionase family DNA binding protein